MVEQLGTHGERHIGLGPNGEMECPRAFSGNLCTGTLFFCVKDPPIGPQAGGLQFIGPRLGPPESNEAAWLVSYLVGPLQYRWLTAMAVGNSECPWALWTWIAEEVLLALSCPESNMGAMTQRVCSSGICAPSPRTRDS